MKGVLPLWLSAEPVAPELDAPLDSSGWTRRNVDRGWPLGQVQAESLSLLIPTQWKMEQRKNRQRRKKGQGGCGQRNVHLRLQSSSGPTRLLLHLSQPVEYQKPRPILPLNVALSAFVAEGTTGSSSLVPSAFSLLIFLPPPSADRFRCREMACAQKLDGKSKAKGADITHPDGLEAVATSASLA